MTRSGRKVAGAGRKGRSGRNFHNWTVYEILTKLTIFSQKLITSSLCRNFKVSNSLILVFSKLSLSYICIYSPQVICFGKIHRFANFERTLILHCCLLNWQVRLNSHPNITKVPDSIWLIKHLIVATCVVCGLWRCHIYLSLHNTLSGRLVVVAAISLLRVR
jgi:hypothetical protein